MTGIRLGFGLREGANLITKTVLGKTMVLGTSSMTLCAIRLVRKSVFFSMFTSAIVLLAPSETVLALSELGGFGVTVLRYNCEAALQLSFLPLVDY